MKYKKCKLILVETGERAMPDQLSLNNTSNKLFMMDKRTYNAWQKPGLENFGEHLRGQYLYIISLDPDEKIEENDWCYVTESHKDLLKGDIFNYNGECSINPDKIKKIIASSDELDSEIIHEKYPNGVNIGIRSCVVLPQPSPEYIQQFITEYNEGNVQDIKVEYEEGEDYLAGNCNGNEIWSAYPDKLKLTNGYITIKEIETNYSFYTDLNMSFKAGANDFINNSVAPLLISEDGVRMYRGDIFWYIMNDTTVHGCSIPTLGSKYYSSKEIAKQYTNISNKSILYTEEEVKEKIDGVVKDLFSYVSSREINGLDPLEFNWVNEWFGQNKKK